MIFLPSRLYLAGEQRLCLKLEITLDREASELSAETFNRRERSLFLQVEGDYVGEEFGYST